MLFTCFLVSNLNMNYFTAGETTVNRLKKKKTSQLGLKIILKITFYSTLTVDSIQFKNGYF